MTIFPIGTSRLHEPLTLITEWEIKFPSMGYFHSSSQVLDVMRIINGDLDLTVDSARFFFRKDQTEKNQFDLNLWNEKLPDSIKRIREAFDRSDTLVIEISSPRTYSINNLHVQGNPNFFKSVSYNEVWKEGYYKKFNPELPVYVYDDFENLSGNIEKIEQILSQLRKNAVIFGHLVDVGNSNAARKKNNDALSESIAKIASKNIKFYDQSHLVSNHGFRILDDGSIDIHHLPWDAMKIQNLEIIEIIKSF